MKRISVLATDSSLAQENSHVSLLNKKFCTQDSKHSSFPSLNQTFAGVGAASQQHQNSSLQYQPSDHLLQQLISSQLTRTLPGGENLTNFDFSRLETAEDKSTMQPVVYNISDNLFQDQFALIPVSLRNNGVGAYNSSFNRDLNLNNLFSLNNNNSARSYMNNIQTQSNLQGQHLNIQLNQQRPLDKLYDQTKKEEDNSSHQTFADEMELRISELISSQNKMLTDFKEKNHLLQDSLKAALDEIKGLNHTIKHHTASGKGSANPLRTHQAINNSNDTASSELLISYLCGPDTDFEYSLILKSELQLPLYRERNFKFTLVLTDKQGNMVQDLEEFPLTLAIYTSENPPKSIETNNSGNKVLKGVNVKSMINGVATFEKIQIKEVTSHLRNGWIFMVVQPMNLQNEKTNPKMLNLGRGKRSVDIKKIKPLVIDKIVVKAKKLKEKDNSEENEDN